MDNTRNAEIRRALCALGVKYKRFIIAGNDTVAVIFVDGLVFGLYDFIKHTFVD